MTKRPTWGMLLMGLAAAAASGQLQLQESDPDVAALKAQPIAGEEFNLVPEDADVQRMDDLVAALSGPDFGAREKAASELIEIGAPAFNRLREAYRAADDLESRLRIEEVVRSAYLNHHVLNRHGFLGISMAAVDASQLGKLNTAQLQQLGNPQLPEGRVGVLVSQVIPNTGAERAGLQKNDVLIGMDGQAMTGVGQDIRDGFSALIRRHGPGSKVQLEVVRGAEVLTLEAVLGRPPESVAKNSNIIKVTPMFHAVSERFITWWDTYFLQPAATAQKTP